jgi:hypothetical protein
MAEETSLLDTIRALNTIGVFTENASPKAMKVRARTIVEQLKPIARWATDQVHGYWIDGEDDSDYCRKHAIAELNKLRRMGGRNLRLGGGYGGGESDSPRFCETCGAPLTWSPTDSGVGQEMEHFASRQPKLLDPDSAQEIVDILELAAECDDVEPEEFEAVCIWLEQSLRDGAIEMPRSRGRCRMTLVVARDRKRRCRRRRIVRVTCPAPDARCADPSPG